MGLRKTHRKLSLLHTGGGKKKNCIDAKRAPPPVPVAGYPEGQKKIYAFFS